MPDAHQCDAQQCGPEPGSMQGAISTQQWEAGLGCPGPSGKRLVRDPRMAPMAKGRKQESYMATWATQAGLLAAGPQGLERCLTHRSCDGGRREHVCQFWRGWAWRKALAGVSGAHHVSQKSTHPSPCLSQPAWLASS